jgi:hypothetical protein
MFELVEVFDPESRRALFGTVMDVSRSGRREVEATDMLANVLRAPSLKSIMTSVGVDSSALFARLSAPPLGDGASEKLQQFLERGETDEPPQQDPLSELGMPKSGGFMTLPLSPRGRDLFASLRRIFAGRPPESVTPREIAIAMLQSDHQLQSVCAECGIRLDSF